MVRILIEGEQPPAPKHECELPKNTTNTVGTIIFCDDCGRYWRLDRYKDVTPKNPPLPYSGQYYVGPQILKPTWSELGMFGTWWYVWRKGVKGE